MLRSPKAFEELQRSRRTRSEAILMARFAMNGLDRPRVGFATGRKLGGAVVRNRVRRRLREIMRSLESRLEPGWDILIVVRPAGAAAASAELRAAVERVLRGGGVLRDEGIGR